MPHPFMFHYRLFWIGWRSFHPAYEKKWQLCETFWNRYADEAQSEISWNILRKIREPNNFPETAPEQPANSPDGDEQLVREEPVTIASFGAIPREESILVGLAECSEFTSLLPSL